MIDRSDRYVSRDASEAATDFGGRSATNFGIANVGRIGVERRWRILLVLDVDHLTGKVAKELIKSMQ